MVARHINSFLAVVLLLGTAARSADAAAEAEVHDKESLLQAQAHHAGQKSGVVAAGTAARSAADVEVEAETHDEDACLLQAQAGHAGHRSGVVATGTAGSGLVCFEKQWYWMPNMPGMRKEFNTPFECQAYCYSTPGCLYFSWWGPIDRGCELQELRQGSHIHYSYIRHTDTVSGPRAGCVCFKRGNYFHANLPGRRTTQIHEYACQLMCARDPGCAYFSFWPNDGGCELHGPDAEMRTSYDEKYYGVVVGPKYGCVIEQASVH